MKMVRLFWHFLKQTKNPLSAYILAKVHMNMEDMAKAFAELSPEDKAAMRLLS